MAVLTEVVKGVRALVPSDWHVERMEGGSALCPPPGPFSAATILVAPTANLRAGLEDALREVENIWFLDVEQLTTSSGGRCERFLYTYTMNGTSLTGEARRYVSSDGCSVDVTTTCATNSVPEDWDGLAAVLETLEFT